MMWFCLALGSAVFAALTSILAKPGIEGVGSSLAAAIRTMVVDRCLQENGSENDLSDTRLHHEICLSDARKVEPAKRKTVIRYPIRKVK